MSNVPDTIPITDLRQHVAGVLTGVKGTKELVIITQRGRAAAVMMSTDACEKAEHDRFTPSARPQFLSALAYIRHNKPDAGFRFSRRAETV